MTEPTVYGVFCVSTMDANYSGPGRFLSSHDDKEEAIRAAKHASYQEYGCEFVIRDGTDDLYSIRRGKILD